MSTERVTNSLEGTSAQGIHGPSPSVPDLNDYQGMWIAWDDEQENILASADTYPQLMERIAALGLNDPVVETAPGLHPAVAARKFTLFSDESPNILDDVRKTIPDPEEWLDTPNTRLWCKKPRELIGTSDEVQLRYLLRGIWSGITS